MFTMNKESRRDYGLINDVIVNTLKSEGTSLEGLDSQIDEITKGYLLAVKCLWIRLPKVNVSNFVAKYQELTVIAMQLLKTYNFDDLVVTFRSINTNLYEVHTNLGRKYNLNYSSYAQFLDDVSSNKVQVLQTSVSKKQSKAPKGAKKQPKVVSLTNSFGIVVNNNKKVDTKVSKTTTTKVVAPKVVNKLTKVVDTKVSKPTTKVVKTKKPTAKAVKVDTKVSKGWHKLDKSQLPLENTFLKITFNDDTKSVFGKFKYHSTEKKNHFVNVLTKDTLVMIPTNNIKDVYYYQR